MSRSNMEKELAAEPLSIEKMILNREFRYQIPRFQDITNLDTHR